MPPEITLDPEPITLDEPKKKTPLFGLAKKAAARKASIGIEQTAAQYESDIGTAKGKAASDIAQGVVLGGAALMTGGLAAGPAAALMGTAGVGSAAIGETLKAGAGSTDVPKSAKGLAMKLGLEGVLSAGGEVGVRAVGQGLKYLGKEVLPALVMRSAAKAEQGQQALVKVQQDSFAQLRTFVRDKGNPTVDIGDNIVQFFGKLKERATGSSATFKESMKPIFAKFWKAAESTGGSLEKQPLDALMEIKTDLSHIAYKTKGMNTDEMVALRDLADQVDGKIVKHLDKLGGDAAKKVYTNYKAFTEQIRRDDGALSVAETGLKKLLGKTAGYIPGVDATIDGVIRGKAAPWALEHLFSNEKNAGLVKKAINMESIGEHRQAQVAFEAAVNASGVGTLLKDWFKPQKETQNAAPQR
jgi:hypothetical protein